MQFKEAYKELMDGKKMMNTTGLSIAPNNIKIEFIACLIPMYYMAGEMVKQDSPVIVGVDEKSNIHRMNEASIINLLLQDDDAWQEYIAPIVEEKEAE